MLEGKEREEVFTRLYNKKPYEPRQGADEPTENMNNSNKDP